MMKVFLTLMTLCVFPKYSLAVSCFEKPAIDSVFSSISCTIDSKSVNLKDLKNVEYLELICSSSNGLSSYVLSILSHLHPSHISFKGCIINWKDIKSSFSFLKALSFSETLKFSKFLENLDSFTLPLTSLTLRQNSLTSLPKDFFTFLRKTLTHLDLSSNKFLDVEKMNLIPFPLLQTLSLRNNSLSSLSLSAILAPSLLELDLSHNQLSSLSLEFLSSFSSLKRLYLDHNVLEKIEWSSKKSFPLSLQDLYLQNNQLTFFESNGSLWNLRRLNLSHNSLSFFPKLGNSSSLKVLDVSFNFIGFLENTALSELTHLEYLNLKNNQISFLYPSLFAPLSFLSSLYLSQNHLKDLPFHVFKGLVELKTLHLENNMISNVTSYVFSQMKNLVNLQLSGNQLDSLSNVTGYGLPKLQDLDLSKNRIQTLDDFDDFPSLIHLNLQDNSLTELKPVFTRSPRLKFLNLANNNIEFIDQNTFQPLTLLQHLNLDSNRLDEINGLFTTQHHLKWLNVSSNRLMWFDYGFIPKSLQWLNLANNLIEEIGNYYDMNIGFKLEILDVSYNHLQNIDRVSLQNSLLQVNLSHNLISELAPNTFHSMANIMNVDLRYNNISKLPSNSLSLSLHQDGKAEFYLSNNPFICNCEMEWFQQINELSYITPRQYPKLVDYSHITCSLLEKRSSGLFSLSQLQNVLPNQFICQYETHCFALCMCCDFFACDCRMKCPDGCSCYHDPTWSANIIQCGNRNHSLVPDMIPMDATSIYLDGNSHLTDISGDTFIGRKHLNSLYLNNSGITQLSNKTFTGLSGLLILYLNNNNLTTLSGGEFVELFLLRHLHLDHNQLYFIPGESFTFLHHLEVLTLHNNFLTSFPIWDLFGDSKSIHSLEFHNNPWICDCEFIQKIQDVIQNYRDRIINIRQLECVSTSKLKNKIGEKNNSKTCDDVMAFSFRSNDVIMISLLPLIILSVLFTLILTTAIICGIIFYTPFKIWLHNKYGIRIKDESKEVESHLSYDLYIHASVSDESFVRQILYASLRDYQFCYPESVKHLQTRILSSSRVLLIISSSLLSDSSFENEMKMILRVCSSSLILIEKNSHEEDFSSTNSALVPSSPPTILLRTKLLSHFPALKNAPYLLWGSKYFWRDLRIYLPELPKYHNIPHKNSTLEEDEDDESDLWTYCKGSSGDSSLSTRSTSDGGVVRSFETSKRNRHIFENPSIDVIYTSIDDENSSSPTVYINRDLQVVYPSLIEEDEYPEDHVELLMKIDDNYVPSPAPGESLSRKNEKLNYRSYLI